MDIKFDYRALRGRIVYKCGTVDAFAKEMGVSLHSISNYLNNHIGWRQKDIFKALSVLDIRPEEICVYFFTPVVQLD